MKTIRIFILLMIGIATVTVAQKADSIVVTYDNQRTIIPIPAFGKQTTIKMADSVQMLEFIVSRRKLSDILLPAQYPSNIVTIEKPLKKTKWYSQIEVGYTLKFYTGPVYESIMINGTEPVIFDYNTDTQQGYKFGISVFEKERSITNKFSYLSGFKLGFAQSFRKGKNQDLVYDTVPHFLVGYEQVTTSSLLFLFPFGFRQYIGSGKLNAKINFGSNFGSSIDLIKTRMSKNYIQFSGSPLIVQPFLGWEIRKFGFLTTMDMSFGSEIDYSSRGSKLSVDYGIGFSLTYRLF